MPVWETGNLVKAPSLSLCQSQQATIAFILFFLNESSWWHAWGGWQRNIRIAHTNVTTLGLLSGLTSLKDTHSWQEKTNAVFRMYTFCDESANAKRKASVRPKVKGTTDPKLNASKSNPISFRIIVKLFKYRVSNMQFWRRTPLLTLPLLTHRRTGMRPMEFLWQTSSFHPIPS